MCVPGAHRSQKKAEDPTTGVTDGYKPINECWKTEPSSSTPASVCNVQSSL